MEPIMQTTKPLLERKVKVDPVDLWTAGYIENNKGLCLIAPNGYVFVFENESYLLSFVTHLTQPGIMIALTMLGDKHTVENNMIIAWDPDQWVNPEWKYEDQICSVYGFVDHAMEFVRQEWLKKSN